MNDRPAKRGRGQTTGPAEGAERRPDPVISASIGRQLRAMYDEVLTEPVPDDLAALVKRLSGKADEGSR